MGVPPCLVIFDVFWAVSRVGDVFGVGTLIQPGGKDVAEFGELLVPVACLGLGAYL